MRRLALAALLGGLAPGVVGGQVASVQLLPARAAPTNPGWS